MAGPVRDGAGFFGLWVCVVSFAAQTRQTRQTKQTRSTRQTRPSNGDGAGSVGSSPTGPCDTASVRERRCRVSRLLGGDMHACDIGGGAAR